MTLFSVNLFALEDTESKNPEPPANFKKLIEAGDVEFDFYEGTIAFGKFRASTTFDFDLQFKFKYRTRESQRGSKKIVKVSVTFPTIKTKIRNVIKIPKSFVGEEFWEHPLVGHEFEHVRINVDPRVPLLARHLVKKIQYFEYEFDSSESFDKEILQNDINKRVAAISKSMTKLIQANNDLLDEITSHGFQSKKLDPNFFNRLYMASNLKEQKFPALQDVEDLLKLRRYQQFAKSDASDKDADSTERKSDR